MCSPVALDRLSLDHLALLASHPRATPTVQAAFSRALLAWTRVRVARLARRWANDMDCDDLVQHFMLRCLTRHLPLWSSHRVSLSPYLFRRLQGDVLDALRARRRGTVDGDVDPDTLIDEERDTEACAARVEAERTLRLVERVVEELPTRQRLAVQRGFAGESMAEVAASLKVHPSTMSREKSAALVALRERLSGLDVVRVAA